jgi:uncharacterized RDD family membrane protein YckC
MAYQPPPPPPASYGYDPHYGQPAYANWGYRVASYLIDGLVAGAPALVGYIIVVASAVGASATQSGAAGSSVSAAPSGIAIAIAIVLYVVSLGVFIWNSFIRQGRTGQSLGKQAVGTRLISMQTGQPIGGGMAFLRYLCHFVDSLACYVGWLWPIWDAQRQTFADKIVGTVVVRTA